MKLQPTVLLAAVLVSVLAADARSDFLIYKLPISGSSGGTSGGGPGAGAGMPGGGQRSARPAELKIVLQGRIVINGKVVTYTHPTLKEQLHFKLDPDTVEIIRGATTQQEYTKRMTLAGKNADQAMQAAVWALKKGLLRDFYAGIDKVLELDPTHEAAIKVRDLKTEMDKPLPENSALEAELRTYVKNKGMRIAKSNHFILLHDTDAKPVAGRKKNRAEERLELLERVYESFLLLFHAQEVDLDVPRDRLKVVLFKDYKDYRDFTDSIGPELASASGFWDPIINTSVFFDHGTSETFLALKELQKQMQKLVDDAKKNRNNPELIRFVKTIDLLFEVEQENMDITVVSHEATHQMAGNTGLLPRHVSVPSWVHEGLATYFESPGDASWAGIGAVNEQRLEFYRALEKDTVHSNIDFIVGDQIFNYAGSLGAILHGYGQAWALTHFMLENHIKEFVSFYRMLGEMPPDVRLSPELLTQLFNRVYGSDHKDLTREWRQYMRTLKTDLQRLEDGEVGPKKKKK